MKKLGLLLLAMLLFTGLQANASNVNVDSLKQEIIKNNKEIREQQKDSIMLSKLSPNQLLELKKQEMEIKKQEAENEGRSDMPFNGFELFLICMLPFLFISVIVFLNVRAKNAESKRRYELYQKFLEMGQTVPEHFFDEPKKVNPSSNLKRGILCLAVGLSLLIYFAINRNNFALIAGIIPSFVGVGYLLVHYLDKPKTDITANNDEQHG